MKNLDSLGFRFKIGEIVNHKLKTEKQKTTTKLLILERNAEECPGGVQLHYLCRLGINGYQAATIEPNKLFRFNEIELESISG